MRWILFRILNVLSILLLVLSAGLCVYSYFSGRLVSRHAGETVDGVGVVDGWLVGVYLRPIDEDAATALDGEIEWQFKSIELAPYLTEDSSTKLYRYPGVVFSTFAGGNNANFLLVHFAWFIGLFSMLPVYALLTRHRSPRRRAKLGQCVKCGYDLRGSGGACPECGAPVAGPATSADPRASEEEGTAP